MWKHPAAIASLLVALVGQHSLAFERSLRPFLENHCHDCHAGEAAEAGLDLTVLDLTVLDTRFENPRTMATWVRIHDRVALGEMPPEDAEPPSRKARSSFVDMLGSSLNDAHAARKGTVLRRLNRREYQNTLNDLFGTNLDLVSMLPEDGRSHEFQNVGESLSISMVQLRRYLDAADLVLETAIATTLQEPARTTVRASYADTRGGEKFLGKNWLKRDDGAVVFFRQWGYPTGMLREASVRDPGRYKIRVTGYAYQSEQPVTFSVGATTFARGAERPTFGFYAMRPGKPQTIELEAWIESRYMIQIEPWGITDSYEIKRKGIENYKGPGLAIQYVEVEGPIIAEFPSRGHRLVFHGLERREIEPRNPNDRTKPWYKPKFEVVSADPRAQVEQTLKHIAARAFRRPVISADVAAYLQLFEDDIATGSSLEDALRAAVTAILCSPDFLYLRERPGQLDDYALASRLSYFLTRTLPDQALVTAAKGGHLSKDRRALLAQTERLLDHQHSERFVEDFTDAWLDLRNMDFTSPDKNLFPEFDSFLKHSMVRETRSFFRELVNENLGIANLVKSDFAMLNNRLAKHYGIDGVRGPEIRRVSLPDEHVRGGFLSQGSVLKVSANGTNTSPVVRGVWVMERILGQAPPPPPPAIAGVEPDIRGAATLRELLDKHRDSQTCKSCHAAIDPPGFALESFNPVGGLRDRFRSLGQGERVSLEINGNKVRYKLGPPVDASGALPDGHAFSGFREFRDYLAENEEALARAFVTKLLTFATGREMGFSDRAEIERIVAQSSDSNHGVRDLIRLVVVSKIFRNK